MDQRYLELTRQRMIEIQNYFIQNPYGELTIEGLTAGEVSCLRDAAKEGYNVHSNNPRSSRQKGLVINVTKRTII